MKLKLSHPYYLESQQHCGGSGVDQTEGGSGGGKKASEEHRLPPINTISMSCSICSDDAASSRRICYSCFQGAKDMIALLNEADDGDARPHASKSTNTNNKGSHHGLKRMREMKEKVSFLDAVIALREGILTDILVKPGNGPPIPAHRAVLAAKSKILRTMLISDECKAAAEDSISFPELSHDELKCLLEFLYSGSLPAPPNNASSSLYYSLLSASDKYDIPFLRQQCRSRILAALHASNALNVLQLSLVSSDAELKKQATNMIVDHAEEVVFSAGYEEFATRNACLSVHVMRAFVKRKAQQAKSAKEFLI